MQNGKQILREFLLWTQRLVIHDDEFTMMDLAEMLNEGEPKTGQAILVSKHQGANITSNDAIHHREKLLAPKVQTAADFFDPLIDEQPTSSTEHLKILPLIDQIGLLCGAGNTTIDN